MANKNEVYKCDICGNVIEMLEDKGVPIKCCGKDMTKLTPQTADASQEKHVPYVEEVEDGYIVSVGKEVEHPMTEAHYIQFIELIIDKTRLHRVELTPNDKPKAHFKVEKGTEVLAREYCNLHGLWSNK